MILPLQAGDPTLAQTFVAFGIIVLLFLGILILQLRADKRNLSRESREHIQAVVGRIYTTDPESERFDGDAVRSGDLDPRGRVRELVSAATGETPERPTSITHARIALQRSWRDLTEDVPRRVLVLGRVAVIAAVFGPIAVSAEAIVDALGAEPRPPSLGATLETAATAVSSTFTMAVDVLVLFPFADLLFALGLTLGITAWTWLFERWWLVVAALAAAAVSIWLLADHVPDRERQRPRRETAAWALGGLVAVFFAGAVPATVLAPVAGVVGLGGVLDALSLLLAVGVAGYLCLLAIRQRRWSLLVSTPAGESVAWPASAARSIYAVSAWLIAIALPLALAWAVYAVVSGNIVTVAGAIATADPVLQSLLVVAIGSLAIGGGRLVSDNWGEIQSALLEAGAWRRARASLWLSGFPFGVALLFYIGLAGVLPLPVAAGLAFALLFVAKWLAGVLNRARYRASLRDSPERFITDPVAEVWVVEDAGGETRYVGRVSRPQVVGRNASTFLAHVDSDAFVDAVSTAVEDLADGDEARPLLADRYATRLMETGETDFEAVETAVRNEARQTIFNALRDDDGRPDVVSREWFDEQVEDIPEEARKEVLQDHTREFGNIVVTSEAVELRNDPFKQESEDRGVRRVSGA